MFKFINHFSEVYTPHDAFIVRTPLFPVETFFNHVSDKNGNAEISAETLREKLQEFYAQPIAREALYIGSPVLHEQLLLWMENKLNPEKKDKTELALMKYMIRSSTRCTPFGLFASCSIGKLADQTRIELSDKRTLQRHVRLDMDYICELVTYLQKQKEISEQLRFYPNSSLYQLGDQLRYIEHRFQEESGRTYHVVEVDTSPFLEKILLAAKRGCRPCELAHLITDDEVGLDDAVEFVDELIDSQVLISELEPHITGGDYLAGFILKLRSLQHTEKITSQLQQVMSEFDAIASPGDAEKNSIYPRIAEHVHPIDVPFQIKSLIQVDGYRMAENCTLNKKVSDTLLAGASLIHLLTSDNSLLDPFSDFKNAFVNRYEHQVVPLAEVLDTESGIGYKKFNADGMDESPLINKLVIGREPSSSEQITSFTEPFKSQLLRQAITHNKTEVEIDEKILESNSRRKVDTSGFLESMFILFRIYAASCDDIDKGNYRVSMQAPSGPSGGNLLGRFCHLHPDIEKLTREILESEESLHPECIYAEIVHLPESRVGNILIRPVLRRYEIPYLCRSTLEEEFQIPLSDLLVTVEDNKVILYSKKLNKRIIPRMANAHNFQMTTLPVYRFLCDLQHQQIRMMGWKWGSLEQEPFLPRVTCGKFILSRARWILLKEDVKEIDLKREDELLQKFTEIIKRKNIPSYALFSQGDHELMLHLENIPCIRLLVTEINKLGSVTLTETLETGDQCWIGSEEGHYTGEFIMAFSMKKTERSFPDKKKFIPERKKDIQRYFLVGSEWLYAKIYCGTKTAEKVLGNGLNSLTGELLLEKIIDKFFFLRYADTGHHLRIRFHCPQNNSWKEVTERLQKCMMPYTENHTVYNTQFETYQREVERYGVDIMEQSEDIFYYHSSAVMQFISLLQGDEGEEYRWKMALKAIDFFLDDFHYTLERKRDLIKMLHGNFAAEFKIGAPQQKKISERFGHRKKIIEHVLNDSHEFHEQQEPALLLSGTREEGYLRAIEEIRFACSDHDDRRLDQLMASYLHMFINRLFVSNQRKTELVIYDHLFRYYEEKIRRGYIIDPGKIIFNESA